MLQKQFDELKLTGCLPSPSGVGLSVLHQTQSENYTLAELSRTLAADPTLTGRILRLANSSLNTGVEQSRTAHQAALRLGVRTVRNVALGFTLVSGHRSGRCRNFDYEHYWSHSLAVAVSAQVLAARVPHVVPSEAFTFGLLSSIGRLALASIHPESYAEILDRVPSADALALAQVERETFGLDNGELCAAMFEDWHLPADYVRAVPACCDAAAETPLDPAAERLAVVHRGARALADALMTSEDDPIAQCRARHERLTAMRTEFSLSAEEFAQLWSQVSDDWREWGKIMSIDASAKISPARLRQLAERAERSASATIESTPQPIEQALGSPAAGWKSSLDETAFDFAAGSPLDSRSCSTRMRVLVVEDDPVARKLIAFHLTRDGHEVFSAADGRQALELAVERRPQLVVTDWMMPEMDGIELVRALRRSEEGRQMQVILLTGREEEARVIEAFDAGADEYMIKPLNPRILMARVRSVQRVVAMREQIEQDAKQRNSQLAELAVLSRRMHAASLTDTLTELPNRRHAMERLQQELVSAQREGTPLSVIMIDIDRFKQVNDQHGHDTGDVVLREVARCLRRCIRATELVCRLGGEEFLVICPRATSGKALLIAERMRLASESNLIQHGGFHRALTLSLGVAELDRNDPSVDRMLKLADERTYQAKQAGRNQVVGMDLDAPAVKAVI